MRGPDTYTKATALAALALSAPLLFLYLASMAWSAPVRSPLQGAEWGVYALYALLIVVAMRGLAGSKDGVRRALGAATVALAALYAYSVGLREISLLLWYSRGHYVVIPPSFILVRCSALQNCGDFSALAVSIPLTVTTALFIYGLYHSLKLLKAGLARVAQNLGEAERGLDLNHGGHDVGEGHGAGTSLDDKGVR